MKSNVNRIVLVSILLSLALSMAGCETTLCLLGDFPIPEPGNGAELIVTAPPTVKKGKHWCRNGLIVKGSPKEIKTLWRKKGQTDEWTPTDSNDEYRTENIGQVLEYMIDVDALGTAILECYGKGAGPYEVNVSPRYSFLNGFRLGCKHCDGKLKTYHLLIELIKKYPVASQTCELDRSEFLRGLRKAHTKANGKPSSVQRVEDLLKRALLVTDIFDAAFRQGVRYIEGKATNDEIANSIRRYLGPPERELAYKAGYIEGYVRTHSRPDKESLYTSAEWMYLSLRLPDRP